MLKPLEELYKEDLEDDSFMTELSRWYLKWKSESETHGVQALPKKALLSLYLSSLATSVTHRFFSVSSVTSCSSERSFSALKRVRNHQEIQQIATQGKWGKRPGELTPFDQLRVLQLREELHARGYFKTDKCKDVLEATLKSTLRGVQRTPLSFDGRRQKIL